MVEPLSEAQIATELKRLSGWRDEDHHLVKTFVFKDFREAVSFIVRLAFYAEAQRHHPELHNVYNCVEIRLTTHDAGNRITGKDLKLAQSIEDFVWV